MAIKVCQTDSQLQGRPKLSGRHESRDIKMNSQDINNKFSVSLPKVLLNLRHFNAEATLYYSNSYYLNKFV